MGLDRPPTPVSIRQPAARSEPTAPLASNSQARTATMFAALASRPAVTEYRGPGARSGRADGPDGTDRDGRLRNESRSISPKPGPSADRASFCTARGETRRRHAPDALSGRRASSSTRMAPKSVADRAPGSVGGSPRSASRRAAGPSADGSSRSSSAPGNAAATAVSDGPRELAWRLDLPARPAADPAHILSLIHISEPTRL